MKGRRHWPLVVCGLLAIAGHGWLLWRHTAAASGQSAEQPLRSMAARLMADVNLRAAPAPAVNSEMLAAAKQPAQMVPLQAQLGSESTDWQPAFTNGLPVIPLPDATVPSGGVRVRVFIEADTQGLPQWLALGTVSDAPPEPQFARVVRAALEQSRLAPTLTGARSRHCLEVSFDAEASQPRLAWHRSTPDVESCLQGAQTEEAPHDAPDAPP